MRIDTLGLLCESNRSTEIVSTEEMQWIQFFITYNLNSQSPGVRQQICSLLKKVKFLFRKCRKVVNFARAQIWGECGKKGHGIGLPELFVALLWIACSWFNWVYIWASEWKKSIHFGVISQSWALFLKGGGKNLALEFSVCKVFFLKYCKHTYFLAVPDGIWGFCSLIRDQTCAPCSESMES